MEDRVIQGGLVAPAPNTIPYGHVVIYFGPKQAHRSGSLWSPRKDDLQEDPEVNREKILKPVFIFITDLMLLLFSVLVL